MMDRSFSRWCSLEQVVVAVVLLAVAARTLSQVPPDTEVAGVMRQVGKTGVCLRKALSAHERPRLSRCRLNLAVDLFFDDVAADNDRSLAL
jgi:hypothetical protein